MVAPLRQLPQVVFESEFAVKCLGFQSEGAALDPARMSLCPAAGFYLELSSTDDPFGPAVATLPIDEEMYGRLLRAAAAGSGGRVVVRVLVLQDKDFRK